MTRALCLGCLLAAALAAGCAASRTSTSSSAPGEPTGPAFTFRGRPFRAAPGSWLQELPLPSSLRERGFAWYDDPADSEAIGDIGMDGITYAYRHERLFEILAYKRGLATEAEALTLADRLQEALNVKHRATAEGWTRRTVRRQEGDRREKEPYDVLEDTRALAAEGAELRIAAGGRGRKGQGRYEVEARFVDAEAARDLNRLLGAGR